MVYMSHKNRSNTERTCVGCRETFPQNELLRAVLEPQGSKVRIDYLGKIPGQGAYICYNTACIKRAAEKGGFQRAFKSSVKTSLQELVQEAHAASQKQLRSLIALASRAGKVAAGNSRVEQTLRQGKGALLVMAHDASQGVQNKFERWAQRMEIPSCKALTKQDLGPTVGHVECSLLMVMDTGFAQKLELEVHKAQKLDAA
mgnify:CR=1 FL=1